ncbi:MAG: hypothetical protein K5870_01310 [Lachnospiraceae bacterium]|nr:hypothetical protein [Lachnospiraceae bacterium]
MRKSIKILVILVVLFATGCSEKTVKTEKVKGDYRTYYSMSDGTWKCDDQFYKYRIELTVNPKSPADSHTYIYLSNMEDYIFEKAWKDFGFKSVSEASFPVEDAILVDELKE